MTNYNSGSEFIESLSREDFHKFVVRELAQTSEFGWLATFRAENTPDEYKVKIRQILSKLGLPKKLMQTDEELDNIATAITSRSVLLK